MSERSGLNALFEAVVNSIHAIEDRETPDGRIEVRIERDPQQTFQMGTRSAVPDIHNFIVSDNGIGFTTKNFESFNTLDSRAKQNRGGKGIGRVLWLKAFEKTSVESIYAENDQVFRRTFTFAPTFSGVENSTLETLPATSIEAIGGPQTTVRLIHFKRSYRSGSPKTVDTIARRIVEHCLEYYLFGSPPRIEVIDPLTEQTIDLDEVFAREYQPRSLPRTFSVGGEKFELQDILLNGVRDNSHQLHFCADKRVVRAVRLSGKVPHLDDSLVIESGQTVTYAGYVRGPYLSKRVNQERTDFDIDKRDQLAFASGLVWEDIEEAALQAAAEYLQPMTKRAKERAWGRIEKYVIQHAPKYRPLLKHRRTEVADIAGNLSDEELDLELHRLISEWRFEARRDAYEELKQVEEAPFTRLEEHRKAFEEALGELQEIAKSDLADYVLHRRMVLDFFRKMQGLQKNNRFSLEEAVHEIFFPLKATSDDIIYDDHNLWILDERLAFHRYLASDIPFVAQDAPVSVQSRDRPDILIFNNPIAYAPDDSSSSAIIIVEFKRPERDNYTSEKNPIVQVLEYVEQIRSGEAKRPDGSTLEVPDDTPFYCYIVATMTGKLKSEANQRGFTRMPSGEGFFHYIPNYRAYIEIISYQPRLFTKPRIFGAGALQLPLAARFRGPKGFTATGPLPHGHSREEARRLAFPTRYYAVVGGAW